MKKRILTVSVIIVLIAGALTTYNALVASKPIPQKKTMIKNTVGVKSQIVSYTDVEAPITYPGRVASREVVKLGAEVTGRIMAGDIPLKAGQTFRKGQVLIRIFSEDVNASLMAQKSSFLNRLALALPDIRIDYPTEYEKWNQFFRALNLEEPLPQLPVINTDKEKVFLAAKNLLSDYYSLVQQEIKLTKYVIRAPFNGTFTDVKKEVGAIASPGGELGTIISTQQMEIVVPVIPADVQWIKTGTNVVIHSGEAEKIKGNVTRRARYVDPTTQSVNIYVSVQSPEAILNGQFLNVEFPAGKLKHVVELPREALVNGSQVYQVKEAKIYPLKVTVVRQNDDVVYLTDLPENTRIVTESMMNAYPGMEVNLL